ncbi:hypothetical protein J6590_051390 [Homalodisca vitripennis]|nr:hypothetical protein J6590_051385 [Homalodisca vitripennis]KAG8326058.1 hypothetical protein J6590_051390 [Homalodisca vitripennis]
MPRSWATGEGGRNTHQPRDRRGRGSQDEAEGYKCSIVCGLTKSLPMTIRRYLIEWCAISSLGPRPGRPPPVWEVPDNGDIFCFGGLQNAMYEIHEDFQSAPKSNTQIESKALR